MNTLNEFLRWRELRAHSRGPMQIPQMTVLGLLGSNALALAIYRMELSLRASGREHAQPSEPWELSI